MQIESGNGSQVHPLPSSLQSEAQTQSLEITIYAIFCVYVTIWRVEGGVSTLSDLNETQGFPGPCYIASEFSANATEGTDNEIKLESLLGHLSPPPPPHWGLEGENVMKSHKVQIVHYVGKCEWGGQAQRVSCDSKAFSIYQLTVVQ